MKNFVFAFLLLSLMACGDKGGEYNKPENGLDAGREFIDNSLKGHFTTAKKYMILSEENNYWLEKVRKDYNRYSEKDKNGYSNASINIIEVADAVPDSVVIINYSNSFIKRPQKLKVIKYNGEWKVDFHYTFSGNS